MPDIAAAPWIGVAALDYTAGIFHYSRMIR
jgi:hypothetical protein